MMPYCSDRMNVRIIPFTGILYYELGDPVECFYLVPNGPENKDYKKYRGPELSPDLDLADSLNFSDVGGLTGFDEDAIELYTDRSKGRLIISSDRVFFSIFCLEKIRQKILEVLPTYIKPKELIFRKV